MVGSHRPALVALSLLLAIAASYVAFDLAGRVRAARGRGRAAWIVGGAAAMGIGVWSVHFVGMLAFRLYVGTARMPVGYDVARMLLAILTGFGTAALALIVASRRGAGTLSVAVSGLLLTLTVVGTHFVAMAAMRAPVHVLHSRPLVLAAIALALVASSAGTWLARRLAREPVPRPLAWRIGGAVVTGTAIAAVHYTAMAAARFTATGSAMRVRSGYLLATDGLAAVVVSATVLILGLALLATVLDRRVVAQVRTGDEYARLWRAGEQSRRTVEESERRFRTLVEATSQVVWTADAEGGLSGGPAWEALTGQRPEAARGSGWLEALHPDDRARVAAAWQEAAATRTELETAYRVRTRDGSYRWFTARGVPVRDPDGHVGEWIGTCTDVHEQRRAEAAQEARLEAARVLASSLELEETLEQVTGLLVPRLADYCIVYLRAADASFHQVAAAHTDPTKAPLLTELGRLYRPNLRNPRSALTRVLNTRQPVLVPATSADLVRTISEDPAVLRVFDELRPVSYMIVPLVVRDELLGSLSLVTSESGRRYDADDLGLAELVGARAALAIDNARLYRETREARDRAVRAAQLESQLAQARLESLRAQLNPHFLFNALNTIAMLVRRGASADAIRGVVSLSELLRRALTDGSTAEVALRAELALVGHYLEIEQLRYRERLRTHVDASADVLDALVPSLVLQPLVENAVRHGIARRPDGGQIDIVCRREEGRLLLEVRDEGPGFPDGWDLADSRGVGLSNTRERLLHMYGRTHVFEATNAPDGGALVRVVIPLRGT